MKGNISVNANEIPTLENLHVVFEEQDHRRALVKEIYLYCDMMSDWVDVTALMIQKEKFMERLVDVLEDHLLNLEIESLNEEAV